jgi:hypothetical protein
MLNNTSRGFNIKTTNLENHKMDHQLYVDDLNSMEQLHMLLDIITKFSESIEINVAIYVRW